MITVKPFNLAALKVGNSHAKLFWQIQVSVKMTNCRREMINKPPLHYTFVWSKTITTRNVGPPYCWAEMYADHIACCPLVSHGEYGDGTYGRTPDHYILLYARCGQCNTVKLSMFVCPSFCKFSEPNKTTKLKGANINTAPTLNGITCASKLHGLNSPE